jgi:hypothetical protein
MRFLVMTIALAVILPAAARGERRTLDKIGPVHPPAYVRSNELADLKRARFKKAHGHQAARPGDGRTIHLDPRVRVYLWAIDASGTFHVAPYHKRADGSENIGHPMLIGGHGARMAGELHFVRRMKGKHVWVLDSDSGRYIKPYPEISAKQLAAARRLVKKIAITSGRPGSRGRPVKLRASFVAPGTEKPAMRPVVARSRRVGGYLLLPPKGATSRALPPRLRSKAARARWQRAARARLAPRR